MANPLTIEIFRVEHGGGFSMPRITLANRRAGGAVPRMVHWICQRHLEILLYGRVDGGSSGAIWKILTEIQKVSRHFAKFCCPWSRRPDLKETGETKDRQEKNG